MNRMIHLLYSTILVSCGLHNVLGFNSALKKEQVQIANDFPVAGLSNLFDLHFNGMLGTCGKKHSITVSAYKKNKRSSRTCEDLTKLLNALKESRISSVKREAPLNHIVKCRQQNENTVTCFSGGKFYQFEGDLQTILDEHTIKIKRFCTDCASRKSQYFERARHGANTGLLTKKLSGNNRVALPQRHFIPYQEVMMEPRTRKGGPQRCYGFAAPQQAVLYSKKAGFVGRNKTNPKPKQHISEERRGSTSKAFSKGHNENLVTSSRGVGGADFTKALKTRKLDPSNYNAKESSGPGNKRRGSLSHLIAKRSQIVSVACRPLYIPTAKPSVNEGRVPQCRIPCGAHNCGPFPTCPCRPSSRTPAPPPTTCPPIPGLSESEATLTLPTRCPAYEFTDEPCPRFECKDGCPYLTTPGCPSALSQPNKGVAWKVQSINEMLSAHPNGSRKVPLGPSTVALEDRGRTRASTQHQKLKAPIGLMAAPTQRISSQEKPSGGNASLVQGSNSNVTGKHRMGSLSKSNGSYFVDPSPKVPAVWSNFDFKKLLKSAKSHYKEKVELNLRNYRNEA